MEEPPRSASDIVLHSVTELGSEKVMRGNGRVCNRTVSNLMAVGSYQSKMMEREEGIWYLSKTHA